MTFVSVLFGLAILLLLRKGMQSDPEIISVPSRTPDGQIMESKVVGAENPVPLITSSRTPPFNAFSSLRNHWPEYLVEAGEMALYLFLICTFATLLLHPASQLSHLIHSRIVRRALMGFLVGSTVVAIITTPWGKQSGGHFNPAITLTFYRLGKLAFWDAFYYVAAQFTGAAAGVAMAGCILRDAPKNLAVRYAVTTPGLFGNLGAFAGEATISLVLMTGILFAANRKSVAQYTPYIVGALYTMFITFETPLSGMSMNPARTFGSAFRAGCWQAFWIYLIAPTVGMLAGAEIFLWARRGTGPYCAKLHHDNDKRCIFRHEYRATRIIDFVSRGR